MTRRSIGAALGLILGIALATISGVRLPFWLLLPFVIAGGAATVRYILLERRWISAPVAVILAAGLMSLPVGYWRAAQKTGTPQAGSLRKAIASAPERAAIHIRGQVNGEPELRGASGGDIRVRVAAIKLSDTDEWREVTPANVLIRVTTTKAATAEQRARFKQVFDLRAYGYELEFETKIRAPEPVLHPGEFDFEAFLLRSDMIARFTCHIARVRILEESRGNPLVELALATKRNFLLTYKQTIRAPASKLVAAATLGTRRVVEKTEYKGLQITDTFRHAGVGHVLAVSGLHVSVVSLLLYFVLKSTGLRPKVFVPIHILFLVLFALLTGARPSSMRAVVMNAVILSAFAYLHYDIRRATFIGIALSAFVILLHRPLVLFAPSFVLSFGAVLSLILISPTLHRWLGLQRGFSLFFVTAWIGAVRLPALLNPWNLMGLVGALLLAVREGKRLNHRYPTMWSIGIERLPNALTLFIAAQLAIQLGMMIPLSAWFFGRFPIAGVVINLLAIPAIGVLVQVGILTGLLGLIPGIGIWLAMPFGAAATVIGRFFFDIAYAGATWFPFPATPKPSGTWLVLYYLVLAGVLALEPLRMRIQGLIYRHYPGYRSRRQLPILVAIVPVLLALMPLTNLLPTREQVEHVICCATGKYPVVCVVTDNRRSLLINAGDAFTADRTVFEVLRTHGAADIDTAVIAGFQPSMGNEGIAALAPKLKIGECWAPLVVDDPATYTEQIGDSYVTGQAAAGQGWATAYGEAYGNLVASLRETKTPLHQLTPGPVVQRSGLELHALPGPSTLSGRFVSSARTTILQMQTGEFKWLILSDSTPEAVTECVTKPSDILVVSDLSSRKSFEPLLDAAVKAAKPRVVILCGRWTPRDFDPNHWASQHDGLELFHTAHDGAVLASFHNGRQRLRLEGFTTKRRIELD